MRKLDFYYRIQTIIYIMGQAYCETCCGIKNNQINNAITDFKTLQGDQPQPKFAKAVKQLIEVNPKIKQIFVRQRSPHIPQRKGTKLNLYYLFAYAAYYDGQWKNGLPHGQGRLIYDDGSIYEGCFKQGSADCRNALFIKQSGTFYKGQVKMNKAQGQGILSSEKVFYRGKWSNDLPHGEGQQMYNRISYYVGHFEKGKKNGFGRYQWNLVQSYQGEFKDNKINGYGKMITKQHQFQGIFVNGQKNGQGILRNTIKNWKYTGQFKHNKMEGKGTYKWADGTVFIGEFENNEKKYGKLITSDGQVIEQTYKS